MQYSKWEISWAFHRFDVEVEELRATNTFILNDSKHKKCANITRTSVNHYIVSVCDYSNYLIAQYKFPTCKKAIEYLQVYFSK